MSNNEKVNLEFSDGGSLGKLNEKAANIKNNLESAAKSSTRIASPVADARMGVSATNMMRSGGFSGATKAGAQAAEDSNTARGIGGLTGAASRDFAAQARGLGGLVHVYATLAANIFAVTAAYQALSKAANIENMVKGLDQLGAASGRNLGTLSKGLVAVSDGALSLADSMTAVAQASAGGMSSENILRMGEVAKKASQALGRDMTDAINRLSRGITKIEPELLDELGIMVKVDEASRDYARSLGKSATALSDFEKRQGYANAVLAEGERKFNAIQLDSNPYQKLAASLNNILQTAGTGINTLLNFGGALDKLASSPIALGAGLAYIVKMLTSQAIPALSTWKKGLAESAAASQQALIDVNKFRKQKVDTEDLTANKAQEAAKLRAEEAQLTLAKLKNAALTKAANFDISTATKEQTANLRAVADAEAKRTEKEFLSGKIRTDAALQRRQEQQAQVASLLAQQQIYEKNGEILSRIENESAAKAKLSRLERIKGFFSESEQYERIAKAAENKARSKSIVNNAVTSAPSVGIIRAWKDMSTQIQYARAGLDSAGVATSSMATKMGLLRTAITYTQGSIALLTGYISTLAASMAAVFGYVALFTAAIAVLDLAFSKSGKEMEKFTSSLSNVDGAVDNITRTLDGIDAKDITRVFSVESIAAKATAFNELSVSISGVIKTFNGLKAKESPWDSFIDEAKDLLPILKGSGEKLISSFAAGISSGLQALEGGPLESEYRSAIEQILNIKDADLGSTSAITKAIEKLGLSTPDLVNKFSVLNDKFKSISQTANNSASALTSFKTGLAETTKLVGDFNNSLLPKDNVGKIGIELINNSNKLGIALKEPIEGMSALLELTKDLSTLSLLPPNTAKELIFAEEELKNIASRLAIAQKQLKKAKETPIVTSTKFQSKELQAQAAESNKQRDLNIKAAEQSVALWSAAVTRMTTSLGAQLDKVMFTAGVDHLTRSMNIALGQGAITAAKGYLSVLKSSGGATAQQETALEQQSIDLQIQAINVQYESIKQMTLLTIAQEEANLLARKEKIDPRMEGGNELAKIDSQLRALVLRKAVVELSDKSQMALLKNVKTLPDQMVDAIRASGTLLNANVGKVSQTAALSGQKESNAVTGRAAAVTETAALAKERLTVLKDELTTKISVNAQDAKLVGLYSVQLQKEKELLEYQVLGLGFAAQQLEIAAKIKNAEDIKSKSVAGSANFVSAENAIADLRAKSAKEYNKYQEDARQLTVKHTSEQIAGIEQIRKIKADTFASEVKFSNEVRSSQLTDIENQLSSAQKLGYIGEATLIQRQAELAIAKQANTAAMERNALDEKWATERAKLQGDIKLAASGPDSGPATDALNRATAEYERQVELQNKKNASVLTGIELTERTNAELEKQRDLMESMLSFTASLALVFGKVGAAIGGTIMVMQKMADKDVKMAKQKEGLIKRQAILEKVYSEDPSDQEYISKEKLKNTTALAKLEQDMAIVELNNISALSAATKQMFDEKTAAYKAFDVIQKITAANAMALQVQQMAQTVQSTILNVQGGVAALFKQGGWAGFVGAAAFLAMMASLGFGGGSTSAPKGFTAEEQQKVQGTGQSYSDGSLVENGGGALGDTTAKSTAIVDGIELLAQNNFTLLQYTKGAMYDALVAIRDNTEQFVKLLVTNLRLNGLDTRNSSSKSFLGFSSKSESVKDAGVILQGGLSDLIEGGGIRKQYENIETKKRSVWGLIKSTKNSQKTKQLNEDTNEVITGIFEGFEDALYAATETLGQSTSAVKNILDQFNIDIKVSSLNKTGEEYAAEVMAAIGIQLDIAAKKAFPNLDYLSDKFQELGETTTDFVVRLVKTAEDVTLGLKSIGKVVDSTRISNMAEFSQNLVQVMGGIEEFLDKTEYFKDNFLTEAERLAPVQKAVTDELNRLGLAFVNTREEFAYVVKTLDITTSAGRDTYASLMNLAEGFAEVYEETRKATTAEEDLVDLRRQYVEILRLEKKLVASVALERELELEEMAESLRVGQKYIWAMEDEAKIKDELTAAYEKESAALKETIDLLDSQVDALEKYKQSLKTGTQSVLTPEEKYTQTKQEAMRVAAIANGIAITEAQKQAKNQAISDLPNAASSFLEASRTLFASSVQYTADYNAVLDVVTATSTALQTQKTAAELQLIYLEASYSALDIIEDNTYTMAQLMPLLLAAQERTLAASTAYYSQVQHPILPPTAPSTVQTGINGEVVTSVADINNKALLAEIQKLNAQITDLRAEQEVQTGNIIVTNTQLTAAQIEAARVQKEWDYYRAFWDANKP